MATKFLRWVLIPIVIFYLNLLQCNSLKFLLYNPRIGRSHIMQMGHLADVLAEAGHEVVNYQPVIRPHANISGVSHPNIRTIVFTPPEPMYDNPSMTTVVWTKQMMGRHAAPGIARMGNEYARGCTMELADEEMMAQLRNEKFDLGINEIFCMCGMAVFAKIGLEKKIVVSGMPIQLEMTGLFGIPSMPSFVPDATHSESTSGFLGRLQSQIAFWGTSYYFNRPFIWKVGNLIKKSNPDLDIKAQFSSASYVWVNSDEFVDFPRPISHKYINIGGLGMHKNLAKAGKLPKEYETIYNKAKAVVYMSFGSNAQSQYMPEVFKKALIGGFREFPEIEFLWKYENDTHKFTDLPSNVHLFKWMPQRDILLHPKTLLFITHGGMNSITEATWSGVPMLCVPLFGDQGRNGEMVRRKGVAEVISKFDLDKKEVIVEKLRVLLKGQSYKSNAQFLAQLIQSKPSKPEERIVQSAVFAASFDVAKHLAMDGQNLNFIEFYNIDVIGFLLFVVAFTMITSIVIFIRIFKFLKSFLTKKTKKE